ncbi:CU044_5270 family protein [Streptomyces sp. NPDC020858]|uniref:CU044_5270 family protein n=1 Tax=Streptomyces sp. NPDC020858 TaxID=3365097 RepID=UPI003796B7BB
MTDRTTNFPDVPDVPDLPDFPDVLDFPDADRLRAAGEVPAPGPTVVEAALLAVRAAAAAEQSGPVPVTAPPRRLRTRRLLVSAVAIAAIAAGVSVYPVSSLRGAPPAATATAADFLRQVAAAEAKGASAAAPYWKLHTLTTVWGEPAFPEWGYSDTATVHDRSTWVGPDAFFLQDGDGEVFKSHLQQFRWLQVPGRHMGLTWEEVKRLPTDPAALKELLARSFPENPRSALHSDPFYLRGLDNLLQDAPLEPLQRAAVYEVLADLPGLRLIGPVKDSKGRAGTAVEVDTGRSRVRMVIDPETGGLLERTLHFLGGEHDGKIAKRVTVLSAGPEQSVPPYREWPTETSPGKVPTPLLW